MGKGKTNRAKQSESWRMIHHRDGRQTLVAPDGRKLAGTRQDVAEAGLSPRSRDDLAALMKLERHVSRSCGFDPAELRRVVANMRLDAIDMESFQRKRGEHITIPVDLFIMAGASARYMGQSPSVFFLDAIRSAVEGTIDVALSDGEAELPLTRQERQALKGWRSDYSVLLGLKEASKTS